MTRKVLLDTDIGSDVDDALALGVLLASPELELVGVTTVCHDVERRSFTACRLLGLAGRSDVEVSSGENEPVLGPQRWVWREIEDQGLPDGPDAPRSAERAAERIVRTAHEVEGLEIVLIGPVTNLARALELDRELPSKVSRITIMGGHVREVKIGDAVCRPGIDYNLCTDPAATVAVLGAGFEVRLVTADVTLQTWLTEGDRQRLAEAPGPLAPVLAKLVSIWTPFQRKIFTGLGGTLAPDNAAFLHDPLTIYSLVDPSPLHFERLRIVPTIERGVLRTLEADPASGMGSEMEVATAVDAEKASRGIVERLLRV